MSCFDPPGPGSHGTYDVPHAYSLPRIPPAVTRRGRGLRQSEPPPHRSGRPPGFAQRVPAPIPRSSSVPGTSESQAAAQMPATAMGVLRMAQSMPPRV